MSNLDQRWGLTIHDGNIISIDLLVKGLMSSTIAKGRIRLSAVVITVF